MIQKEQMLPIHYWRFFNLRLWDNMKRTDILCFECHIFPYKEQNNLNLTPVLFISLFYYQTCWLYQRDTIKETITFRQIQWFLYISKSMLEIFYLINQIKWKLLKKKYLIEPTSLSVLLNFLFRSEQWL